MITLAEHLSPSDCKLNIFQYWWSLISFLLLSPPELMKQISKLTSEHVRSDKPTSYFSTKTSRRIVSHLCEKDAHTVSYKLDSELVLLVDNESEFVWKKHNFLIHHHDVYTSLLRLNTSLIVNNWWNVLKSKYLRYVEADYYEGTTLLWY